MKSCFPVTSLGWHNYYVNRFNKHQHLDQEYLAMLYLFFHLAFEA